MQTVIHDAKGWYCVKATALVSLVPPVWQRQWSGVGQPWRQLVKSMEISQNEATQNRSTLHHFLQVLAAVVHGNTICLNLAHNCYGSKKFKCCLEPTGETVKKLSRDCQETVKKLSRLLQHSCQETIALLQDSCKETIVKMLEYLSISPVYHSHTI